MEGFGRDCKSMLNEPEPHQDKSFIATDRKIATDWISLLQ
jgi:hypothetical protein